MMDNHIYEESAPELALQRLRNGYMLMVGMALRMTNQADTIGDKNMKTIAEGVMECLKMAKEYADKLEVED